MVADKRFYSNTKVFLLIASCFFVFAAKPAAADEEAFWRLLKSPGHFAIMRHAVAPGTGDPANFALDNCDTQRNLSDEGRTQAAAIGSRFRANGIDRARVYSSQWCRCLETARLLSLGPVQELPFLNSFFQAYERSESQTRLLKQWLGKQDLSQPLVLVTHQVNITALTGVYPASGEIVLVRRSDTGEFTVVDRHRTPETEESREVLEGLWGCPRSFHTSGHATHRVDRHAPYPSFRPCGPALEWFMDGK